MKIFAIVVAIQCNWVEVMASPFNEIISSLKLDSIGGNKVTDLLSEREGLPKEILGVEVQYFDAKTSYVGGQSQVTLQFSKLGTGINEEVLNKAISSFPSLNSKEEFGQTDYKWAFEDKHCSISVHKEDDIFEYSCWK